MAGAFIVWRNWLSSIPGDSASSEAALSAFNRWSHHVTMTASDLSLGFLTMGVLQEKPKKSPSYAGLKPASEAASRAKRSNRKKDTRHELLLRAALWRMGLRYRKYVTALPGNPDLVFSSAKVVVFCDGDFWHGRNWRKLKKQLERRHNATYWVAKIARNRKRDAENIARLEFDGWHVVRLWETDIIADPIAAAQTIFQAMSSHRARRALLGQA